MSWMRRREFLRCRLAALGAIGLAACQSAAPAAPTSAPAAAKPTAPPAAAPTAAARAGGRRADDGADHGCRGRRQANDRRRHQRLRQPPRPPARAARWSTASAATSTTRSTRRSPTSIRPIRVTLNVCEPLVWEPEPGKFVPGLAESWDISPDAKVYTFKLKKGVKFHDGTPFNGAAVKFTFDRVDRPGDQSRPVARPARAVRPHRGRRRLHHQGGDEAAVRAAADQPERLSRDRLADGGPEDGPGRLRSPSGRAPAPSCSRNGCAKDHITLVKNPDYNWGSSFFKHTGPAYLDQVTYKIIPEPSVRTGTLKTGETHIIDDIDPLEYATLSKDPNFGIIEKGQPGSGWILLLNTTSTGAISDPAVRQAMEYAVDREGVNTSVFQGLNKVAWSPLMRPTFGYDAVDGAAVQLRPRQSQAAARRGRLAARPTAFAPRAASGWRSSFPIISRPRDKAMAESVQASLRDVGIDLKVDPLERAAARDAFNQNRYDVGFMWFSYGDPDVLRTIFHSANVEAFNRAKYQVPEVDKMLEDAAGLTDRGQARRPLQTGPAAGAEGRGHRAAGGHHRLQRQTRRGPGRDARRAGIVCVAERRPAQEVN